MPKFLFYYISSALSHVYEITKKPSGWPSMMKYKHAFQVKATQVIKSMHLNVDYKKLNQDSRPIQSANKEL